MDRTLTDKVVKYESNDLYLAWDAFEKLARDTSADKLKVILCMLVDYTAAKSGTTSVELLDLIYPMIIETNEELGAMTI